jgi:uncharacterized protein (UPF0254 family)
MNKIIDIEPKTNFERAFRTGKNIIPEKIPKRRKILGNILLKKHLSILGAVPGCGKTTLAFGFAFSIASGLNLFDEEVHEQGPVWYHNAEDPIDEMEMKLIAYCKFYNVKRESLPLIVTGCETKINFNGTKENDSNVIELLTDTIKKNKIIAVFLDPFINIHTCVENDNPEMNKVMIALKDIANKADCAIMPIHHYNKGNEKDLSIDKFRGGSSIIGAVRVGIAIYQDENNFIHMKDVKKNLSKKFDRERRYKIESQIIENGEDIGVAVYYDPSNDLTENDFQILDILENTNEKKIKLLDIAEKLMEITKLSKNPAIERVRKTISKNPIRNGMYYFIKEERNIKNRPVHFIYKTIS